VRGLSRELVIEGEHDRQPGEEEELRHEVEEQLRRRQVLDDRVENLMDETRG
jgi:transcriptional regulator NrdR family protein